MNDHVFINCPFDENYRDCFEAILFTLTIAGYSARCALEEGDSGDIRFNKLCKLVASCDTTIHDLSRVELGTAGLPRFNMPLELGLTLGAKHFGGVSHSRKRIMIMVVRSFEMPKYMSDLAGHDPHPHGSNPKEVIRIVRNFLHSTPDGRMLPGPAHLCKVFEEFHRELPRLAAAANLEKEEYDPFQSFRSYMEVLRAFVTALKEVPDSSKSAPARPVRSRPAPVKRLPKAAAGSARRLLR